MEQLEFGCGCGDGCVSKSASVTQAHSQVRLEQTHSHPKRIPWTLAHSNRCLARNGRKYERWLECRRHLRLMLCDKTMGSASATCPSCCPLAGSLQFHFEKERDSKPASGKGNINGRWLTIAGSHELAKVSSAGSRRTWRRHKRRSTMTKEEMANGGLLKKAHREP